MIFILTNQLMPLPLTFPGSQLKSSPIEPPAGFKKEAAKKAAASSIPSMEDQLKDLLKGNSEESLVAPGHNSTRFHLDYTNAGLCRIL